MGILFRSLSTGRNTGKGLTRRATAGFAARKSEKEIGGYGAGMMGMVVSAEWGVRSAELRQRNNRGWRGCESVGDVRSAE